MKITIELEKYNSCATCVSVCPVNLFKLRNEKYSWKELISKNMKKSRLSFTTESDECATCKTCIVNCSNEAIKVEE